LIVVTLASMVALRDGLRWATEGAWIEDLPGSFQWFGLKLAAFEAVTAAITAVLLCAAAWGLHNLFMGRAVYAVGSNEAAARLAGIDSARAALYVFAMAGALTGVAALLNAARFNQIPSNAGLGMELKVIAAVVVGGTAIQGGRGTVAGTLLGVILLGAIGPALIFLGVSAYWEKAIQGAIILAAVGAEAWPAHRRLQGGRLGHCLA
jgi:rhamnose transport system permease protein